MLILLIVLHLKFIEKFDFSFSGLWFCKVEISKVPEEIRSFVYKYINSLEQLEILFFLYKGSNNKYSAIMINQQLRSNLISIEDKLEDLFNKDLIVLKDSKEKIYQYDPKNTKLASLVKDVYLFYKNNYHTVVSLIYSKPMDNILSFADSFKVINHD